MSSQVVNVVLILGVITIGGLALINRCEWFKWCDDSVPDSLEDFQDLLGGLFQGGKPNSQADNQRIADAISKGTITPEQYNQLPTIGKNQTSIYRSTLNTSNNPNAKKNAAKVIASGQLHPDDPQWTKLRAKSGLALSLLGRKMSLK